MTDIRALIAEAERHTDGYTEEDASGPIKVIIRLTQALEAEHKRAEGLLVDLDARLEHSDHTAAKNWRRMRTAERLRDETAAEVLTFREQYIPRLTAAEAERDRYRAEAESARTTGERILADALRYRAAIEDIRAEHQDFTIPHDEALSNIGTILTRALTEGAADV